MAKVGEPHDSNCMVRAHNEWPCTCGADELEIECRCRCGHTLDQHAQSEWEKIKPALVCTVCLCAEFMGGGRLNGRAPDCNSGVVTPQAGSIPARRTNSLSDGI